ncbi:hypothetical protein CDV55_102542 [Aspergillus turcosus]|nr:hypothetical protein CDV55_102542 [Aspergillus turcosus]
MLRSWKRRCRVRLEGIGIEDEADNGERQKLLPKDLISGKYTSPSQVNVKSRSQAQCAPEQEGRYMSFGIGGAGNIRSAFEMDKTLKSQRMLLESWVWIDAVLLN